MKIQEIETKSEYKNNIDLWASRVLKVGIWSSALLMISGLILAVMRPASSVLFPINNLGQLAVKMLSGEFDPAILMFSGIVMLMFTPILRVITTVIGFAVERDWRFVVISVVVLLMLAGEIIYSIIIKG